MILFSICIYGALLESPTTLLHLVCVGDGLYQSTVTVSQRRRDKDVIASHCGANRQTETWAWVTNVQGGPSEAGQRKIKRMVSPRNSENEA